MWRSDMFAVCLLRGIGFKYRDIARIILIGDGIHCQDSRFCLQGYCANLRGIFHIFLKPFREYLDFRQACYPIR